MNLFNLLPLGPLDGGRAFRALARGGRWLVVAGLLAAYWATKEGLLMLLVLVGALRAFGSEAPASDRRPLAEYLVLVGGLSALSLVPDPISAPTC